MKTNSPENATPLPTYIAPTSWTKSQVEPGYNRYMSGDEEIVHWDWVMIRDTVEMDCPACECHGTRRRYMTLGVEGTIEDIAVDFDCCEMDEVEYTVEGEPTELAYDKHIAWRLKDDYEDYAAAEYEYYAHGCERSRMFLDARRDY